MKVVNKQQAELAQEESSTEISIDLGELFDMVHRS